MVGGAAERGRGFARYLARWTRRPRSAGRADPEPTHRIVPYIYSDEDIGALSAAGRLSPEHRADTYQTLIGLLAVTGMFSAGHPLRRKPISAFAQLSG